MNRRLAYVLTVPRSDLVLDVPDTGIRAVGDGAVIPYLNVIARPQSGMILD
jgi:hypothetical protein